MENNYTQEEKDIVEKLTGSEGSFMLPRHTFESILSRVKESVTKKEEVRYTNRVSMIQSIVDYIHTAHVARVAMVPLAIILVVAGGVSWKTRMYNQSIDGITHSMSQDIAKESSEEQKIADDVGVTETLSIIDYGSFEN